MPECPIPEPATVERFAESMSIRHLWQGIFAKASRKAFDLFGRADYRNIRYGMRARAAPARQREDSGMIASISIVQSNNIEPRPEALAPERITRVACRG
jgi:hypothetical protein